MSRPRPVRDHRPDDRPRPDHARQLSLYVALGDSFTAGTGCPPGEAWPDRLASGAARAQPVGLAFRNLAVEGATSAQVLEQLPEALELEPDLVTVVCGANDVLRHHPPRPRRLRPAARRDLRPPAAAPTRPCGS